MQELFHEKRKISSTPVSPGANPERSVVDALGNFYGVTGYGDAYDRATVYETTPCRRPARFPKARRPSRPRRKASTLPTVRSLRTWCVFSAQHHEILFVFSYATTASFTWRHPTETAPRHRRVPCRGPNCGKFSGCLIATACRGFLKITPARRRLPVCLRYCRSASSAPTTGRT
jgi:hypothetical protein